MINIQLCKSMIKISMNHMNMEGQIERNQTLATTRLYDAALKGDVQSLLNLLKEDPLILDRCIIEKSAHFMQSPLHVAANLGHLAFTKKILDQKPELAEEVDQLKRWSPLHMASAKGHLQIVETLLVVKSNLCFARDQEGRNSLHVAAVHGRIQVLEVLLRENLQAAFEPTMSGESVLHLCVKYCQAEALKYLVEITDENVLLNAGDSSGNTVLHLAVAAKQPEMVEYLLARPKIEKNAMNKKGMTAVDTHQQSRKDLMRDGIIWKSLNTAKALPAKEALNPQADRTWLENQRTSLMVVATLIATMAFQTGINPPGGVWQDQKNEPYPDGHKAGTSIWSYDGDLYDGLLISNTIGLISSLSVILLLISGLPCKKYFVFILRITLWIAVTTTAVTYFLSVSNLEKSYSNADILPGYPRFLLPLVVWLFLMGIIFLGHVMRFILKLVGWHRRQAFIKLCKRWFTRRSTSSPLI